MGTPFNMLSSFIIPSTLPGESKPPFEQHYLPKDERIKKEKGMFNAVVYIYILCEGV